jgi:putative membrane protein
MGMIKNILCGVAIGIACIIPGVSGGTMMISMGIYTEILEAVSGFFTHWKKSLHILFPYAAGIGAGILGFSFILEYLLCHYPFQTAMAFIGLILGGVPQLLPKVSKGYPDWSEVMIFVLAAAVLTAIQLLGEGQTQQLEQNGNTAVVLLAVGLIVAATMVIPGVSGSAILMAMGFYESLLYHINRLIQGIFTLEIETISECISLLFPFGLGVAGGIFLMAKLVEHLLKKYERKSYFGILGFLAASPLAILGGLCDGMPGMMQLLAGIVLLITGFFISDGKIRK